MSDPSLTFSQAVLSAKRSDMSKTTPIERIRDGRAVAESLAGGGERRLPIPPMRPLTGADIQAATVPSAASAIRNARPTAPEDMIKARPVSHVKTLRQTLGLTQEEFAARYRIPLGTLRDWEQGRTEPDQPARAYIKIIARDPDWVLRALASTPQ
jgi:putative transcriptional regulator